MPFRHKRSPDGPCGAGAGAFSERHDDPHGDGFDDTLSLHDLQARLIERRFGLSRPRARAVAENAFSAGGPA